MSNLATSARALPVISSLRIACHAGAQHGIRSPIKDELFQFIRQSAQTKRYQFPEAAGAELWPGGGDAYERMRRAWLSTKASLRDLARYPVEEVLNLPNVLLQNTTEIVLPSLNAAKHYAETLIVEPDNVLTRYALSNNLQLLSTNFAQFGSLTTPIIDGLKSAAAAFDDHARLMAELAGEAAERISQNQAPLANLNQQLDDLSDNAVALAVTIAGGSLNRVAGLVMGCIDVALAPAAGQMKVSMVVPAGIIMSEGVAVVALDSLPIQRQRASIDALSRRLTRTQGHTVLINAMAAAVCAFGWQLGTLRRAMTLLIEPWSAAAAYFSETLNQVSENTMPTMSDWIAVDADLDEISRQWSALCTYLRELKIDPQVSGNSQLRLGMDEQQVRGALARAGSQTLTQFLAS
ncbi:MAG: hypothetical protein JWN95_1563 [Frankiales bacterium]|nr:hypothetical protein [Frankiales bacterium]